MDLDQAGAGGENIGRNEAFGNGVTGTPWTVASSLNRESAVFNAKVAGSAYAPHSILQPLMRNPGGNGMSVENASNRDLVGNYMGSGNGYNPQSYQQANLMRLMAGRTMI